MGKYIVIGGPTACGKTALAVELALRLGGEVISADSMQVYRRMDIGTAKPTPEERRGVPHHLLDVAEPEEIFNVLEFQRQATQCLGEIFRRGKVPIVAGGTGFYLNALLRATEFVPAQADREFRASLYAEAAAGVDLHSRLSAVDREAAQAIHPNNLRRIVRALEYFHATGEPISRHNAREKNRPQDPAALVFLLEGDRQALYRRIDARAQAMVRRGLPAETQALLDAGCGETVPALGGLGYKEMILHLRHGLPLPEATALLQQNTRHYARRQITWFKNQCEGFRFNVDVFGNYSIMVETLLEIFSREENTHE
jgi:tRNA dimethylallyltransferase